MKNYFKILLATFLLLFSIKVKTQSFNGIADSVLLKNAYQLRYAVADSAILIVDFLVAKKQIHDTIRYHALEIGGDAFWHKGSFVKSIDYYNKALLKAKDINDAYKVARQHGNLGYLYMEIAEYDKAIEELKESMEISLKNNFDDRYLIASTYLASVWGRLKQYEKGIEIQKKALEKVTLTNDSISIAIITNNIGSNYLRAGILDSSAYYYNKSLLIDRKMNHQKEMANTLMSLAEIYFQRKELNKAQKTLVESIDIYKNLGTTSPLSLAYILSAKINAELKNYDTAKRFLSEALLLAQQTNSRNLISSAYLESSKVYKSAGDIANAFKYMELYVYLNDSIYQEESATKIAQMAVRLELSGKEKEIELLNIDKKLQQLELKNKRNQQYGLYGGLILVIAFAGFMYNRFKITQKQKAVIEQQKEIVEKAHLLLEEKNNEVIASIRYAKRIQDALLTSQKYIERNINRLKASK